MQRVSLSGSAGFFSLVLQFALVLLFSVTVIMSLLVFFCLLGFFLGGGGYHFNSCAFNYNGINLSLLE